MITSIAHRNVKRVCSQLAFGLVACTGLATAAHAAVYSDLGSYTAAAGAGSAPLTFADVSVPDDPVDTFNDVSGIASNRYAGWSLPNASVVGTNYGFGIATQALLEDTSSSTMVLNLTNPGAVSVGFNVAVFGGGGSTISVFDGSTVLSSTTVDTADETQLTTFFGYVGSSPITEVTITPSDSTTLALATNLQYSVAAVPEPAPIVFGFCGLAFLAGLRRTTKK